ncbi:MAG: hypothetical protein IKQ77_12080, partial [Prevotella sp.]|nr:hypothetical protein [Prevotella sp.]
SEHTHWRSGGHKTRPYDFGGHSCHGDAGKRRPLVRTPHWRSGGHKTRPYDFGGHSWRGDAGKRRPLMIQPFLIIT